MRSYKQQNVLRLLNRYPEMVETALGQSAMALDDIGGKGGLTGKAKAQKKEELLCMIIDLNSALERMSTEDRKVLYETYVINESKQSTPQLRALVREMNYGPSTYPQG